VVDHDGGPPRPYGSPAERLAHARAELARAPVVGVGDGFLVDPERARAAIAQLDEAVLDIRQALTVFSRRGVEPPTMDPVGRNLAVQMAELDRRAEAFALAWIADIEATRDEIQQQIDAHVSVDSGHADRWA
jgi:proteasome assembly chaperone (PAC2) family protein